MTITPGVGAGGNANARTPECEPWKTGASAGTQCREGGSGILGRQRLPSAMQFRIGMVLCVRDRQYLAVYPAQGVRSTPLR